MEATQFKLSTASTPVVLEGDQGPIEMEMREMNAAQRDRYLDQLSLRMRLDTAGRPAGVKKFEGLQSGLVVLCLRRKDGKQITEQEIQAWPATVVSGLFKLAQDMNHLNEAEANGEPPKND